MKPVDQLTLVEVIREMDGLVPFDDQVYAVRVRAAADMGERPDEMSTWDHPAVVRYGELCVRVKQLMAEATVDDVVDELVAAEEQP